MRNASVTFISFAICVLNLHCQEDEKNSHLKNLNRDTATSLQNDSNHKIIGDTVWTWVDTLVINYVKHTHNKLISFSKKDTMPLEWYKDIEQRNGIKYFVVEIGKTFEHRFIPRSWLYIDSATRKVYENDIAKDTLIEPR
ncbi:MAG TPA: hypothetical protein VIM07_11185 [Chitinophagaceae bacterium]